MSLDTREFKWEHPRAWKWGRNLFTGVKVLLACGIFGLVAYLAVLGFQGGDPNLMQGAEILLIAVSVTLVYVQMRKQHEWNRRNVSQDLLFELAVGHLRSLRGNLEVQYDVDYTDPSQSFEDVYSRLPEDQKEDFYRKTRNLFNYFEVIAVGIENGILSDEICFDTLDIVLTEYYRWGQRFIDRERPEGEKRSYAYLQALAEKWRPRREMIEERISKREREAQKDGSQPPFRPL